jgi:protein SCO1
MLQTLGLALVLLAGPALALAHDGSHKADQRLPTLGTAPEIALTSQDGKKFSLGSLRGKVIAVAFIYTNCPDVCSLLTDKMVRVQDALGPDFGTNVAFVSITVDPERDTPEVLKDYAVRRGANLGGWSFLTGDFDAVREAALDYGVVVLPASEGGGVDHNTLTTLIDRKGTMRVKYIGSRFDPEEFRNDLLDLVNEP